MVIVCVQWYLLIVPNLIFQTASLVYRKLVQFASMNDKRAAIIEIHCESKSKSEIIKLLKRFDDF